jgi:polyisoprenoid-binding protein YceI
MTMKLKKTLLIAIALTFSWSTAYAQNWQADQPHTEIRFEIKHILTTVSGYFRDYKAIVSFDPEHIENSAFNFKVNVKSIDTNNEKRDIHLNSPDFFDSEKYPEMTFVSKKISKLANGHYELEGILTIKDVSKPIKTEFQYFPPQPHPMIKGKVVSGYATQFTLNRLDYNVGDGKFSKMGVVGQDVTVTITMEALKDK